jgi:iron complex transport system substrate-binding protein
MPLDILTDPLALFHDRAPQRVVSLIPSWTASLSDLGLGHHLVGVTTFCPIPAGKISDDLVRVGPPKGARLDRILSLKPDLVIANREENDKESILALLAEDIPVWLTFPKTVKEMLDDLWQASSLFRSETAPYQLEILEKSIDWAESVLFSQDPVRYFCPIWQDCTGQAGNWWMTFNQDTYSSDVLRLVNGENIFSARERRYPLEADLGVTAPELPGERDTRYPRVSLAEIVAAQPEVILLPDEPYEYNEGNIPAIQALFAETPAVQNGRIYLFSGRLVHWPGTIVSQALEHLPAIFTL